MRKFALLALLLIAAIALSPLAIAPVRADDPLDLIALAKTNKDLSLLVEAVEAAGLTPVLQAAGPFTVFAPTNDAFVAALADLKLTKDALFKDKDALTNVLVYHVLPGILTSKVVAATAASSPKLATLNMGQPVTITTKDSKFFVNDAQITAVDVRAKNGIVHVINKVILPKETYADPKLKFDGAKSLIETATGAGTFKTLLAAVTASKPVADYLTKALAVTVFAPTDEAFAGALAKMNMKAEDLLASKDLARILSYHVVPFAYPAEWLVKADGVWFGTAAEDTVIQINVKDGKVMVNGALTVIKADIVAANGVIIHAIDGVLLPPAANNMMEATPAATPAK